MGDFNSKPMKTRIENALRIMRIDYVMGTAVDRPSHGVPPDMFYANRRYADHVVQQAMINIRRA